MSVKINDLLAHARRALDEKWGYIYGTYGQMATQSILDSCASRYPNLYTPAYKALSAQWLGRRATDWSGLIKGFMMWKGNNPVYNPKYDQSANGFLALAKKAGSKGKTWGDVSSLPEIPGLFLHRPGHIGIYIGNGQVIEAKGAAYGVVLSRVKDSVWNNWSKCPLFIYEETKPQVAKPQNPYSLPDFKATYKKGCRGAAVYWIQYILKELGYYKGKLDGDYGNMTETAVTSFQRQYKLAVDGDAGPQTLGKLKTFNK